ncbi:MAG: methyltransferase domain-containing protein [Vicinamibacteraceae bacterium]|nr:methyltransferase domain-containing protein [Vicinamibacteraceae bacterium]
MPTSPTAAPTGEYAARGDYHVALDPHWDYLPTYLAKLKIVRGYLDRLAPASRVLDAGCGEGVLVEQYAGRLAIEGLDANYESPRVRRGSLLALPWTDGHFDMVLCLDVLEHLQYAEQGPAIAELARVVRPGGTILVSVPNLAHLQSRVHLALTGRLIRTASELKHPGDRPAAEYQALFRAARLVVERRHGIFPTIPIVTAAIRRRPVRLAWLHRLLTAALPVPGWCFLNIFVLRRPATPGRA